MKWCFRFNDFIHSAVKLKKTKIVFISHSEEKMKKLISSKRKMKERKCVIVSVQVFFEFIERKFLPSIAYQVLVDDIYLIHLSTRKTRTNFLFTQQNAQQ